MDERRSPLLSLGLGTSLAAALHAESDPAGDFPTARQYAAYAGLEPTTFESGQMKGSNAHISKRGSPHLRRALYLSAFVVFRKHDYTVCRGNCEFRFQRNRNSPALLRHRLRGER